MNKISIVFIVCLFAKLSQAYNYNNYNYGNYNWQYEDPLNGSLQWRYIPGLGYRKFTPYGALQRDYSVIRDTFYYGYYNYGGGSIRF